MKFSKIVVAVFCCSLFGCGKTDLWYLYELKNPDLYEESTYVKFHAELVSVCEEYGIARKGGDQVYFHYFRNYKDPVPEQHKGLKQHQGNTIVNLNYNRQYPVGISIGIFDSRIETDFMRSIRLRLEHLLNEYFGENSYRKNKEFGGKSPFA